MQNWKFHTWVPAAVALAVLPLGGCVALVGAGAGAGGAAYVENGGVANYYAYYPVSISRASRAVQGAFSRTGIRYDGAIRKNPDETVIEGTDGRGRTARVTLTLKATDVCKVNIRIGTFGDRALSLRFQRAFSRQLGIPASAQPPAGTGQPVPPPVPGQAAPAQQPQSSSPQQTTIPLQ